MNPGDGQGYDTDERYGGAGQTRTRLPGDDEAYDTTRRSMRPSRSLITVVGVVVLLIAAIAFANQGGSPDTPSDARGPAPSETAPTGTRPVDTTTSGIPTNHPRTKQGAESAAANYAVALVSAEIIKPRQRTEIIDSVFVPEKKGELRKKFDTAYSDRFLSNLGLDENGEAASGSTYVSRTAPVGTKARSFSSDRASLEVWCTGVYGTAGEDSRNPVTSDWFTLNLELRWVEDDWKVESFSQSPGPAPVNGDNRVSPADEIAKAVEGYGGFTYAR
ncbi:hypothetical protein ACFWMQ_28410 [Streptomyces sp. NPDC058372]|uniref:hypothetical protein n=1 Tax=Streptomyces sp. NPDC058372 TaxID=3346464 RepID=UPI00364EFFD0